MLKDIMIGRSRVQLKTWIAVFLIFNAIRVYRAAPTEAEDIEIISPWQLESLIEQLNNLSPNYQLHVPYYRNEMRDFLHDPQSSPYEQQQQISDDYDYPDEDKRSVASLASHGGYVLMRPGGPKRSLATLAKNGQLPTQEPDYVDSATTDRQQWNGGGSAKRNIGSLARSGGGYLHAGKRNIGTLARDFQLPQSGKRNVATMARLGLLTPKRHIASFARLNSLHGEATEKRNIGALKGSPVHGISQKKNSDQMFMQPDDGPYAMDTGENLANFIYYPSYGDWLDSLHEEKRFLDSKNSQDHNTYEPEIISSSNNEAIFHEHKRHIGSLARSGLLPAAFRPFRSGRFSRSGRTREIVEYYRPPERLRLPTAAVCRQCFLPYKQVMSWRMTSGKNLTPKKTRNYKDITAIDSLRHNLLPTVDAGGKVLMTGKSWGTPPRITALHRSSFRQNPNYSY